MTPFPPTALSPATQAAAIPPTADEQTRLFEDKFSQMAYRVFSSQFPDLIQSVVTFKIVDSDIEQNMAVGAFVIEREGQFLYVPVVLTDNQLKPFDLVYVKDRDIFVPLTQEWLDELSKGTLNSLGEGVKLPSTVATDVDIRNIVVPPTTGRYSYAHYVSPANQLAAEATEPLGRKLHKLAGSTGESTSDEFNPEVWSTFNEQFQRVQGMSPGQAIDGNTMDVATLAKMYKQHARTWDMATQSAYANGLDPSQVNAQGGMPNQGQPMQGMPMQGQPQGMPPANTQMRTASFASAAARRAVEEAAEHAPTLGNKLDSLIDTVGSGALGGAAIGGVTSSMDQDLGEVPGAMLRGALGGAVGAPLGRAVGGNLAKSELGSKVLPYRDARALGTLVGGATGGFLGSKGTETNYQKLRYPFGGAQTAMQDPYGNMVVTAEEQASGLRALFKHANAPHSGHKNVLPELLKHASDNVKKGFAQFLSRNPQVMKIAADIYGEQTLIDALTTTPVNKTAGMQNIGGQLYIADKNTAANDYFSSFGSAAPLMYQGVLLKGYAYSDKRPGLNLAVQTQEYHDFHEPQESGVYLVYPKSKAPEAALVFVEPLDLLENEDRPTFPKDPDTRVKKPLLNVPANRNVVEDDTIDAHALPNIGKQLKDVERSRQLRRLFVMGDGRYGVTMHLIGEQIAETALKDTALFKRVLSDGAAEPRSGRGMFVHKRGIHYFATMPVELSDVNTDSNKVIRATITSMSGWGKKTIVIDPRVPGSRIRRPRDSDTVIVPRSWKWVPLKDKVEERSYLSQPSEVTRILIDALGSAGKGEIVARRAGEQMYAVGNKPATSKVAALRQIAEDYYVHASAAEAILKIAEAQNSCRAYVVNSPSYKQLREKTAQLPQPMPAQTAPQAPMQQEIPQDPNMGAYGAPPAMASGPGPVEQAFQETAEELQNQINELQAQLNVLMTVQERANQLSGGSEEVPQDPQTPQATQAPQAPQDPMAMPEGQDPAAMQGQPQQQLPMMRTEGPSSEEIASQINPDFLAQAGNFQDAGAFDASAVGSLAKNPSLANISTQYAANLEDSVDDLGRTLLTLYMQENELKGQLGDDAFVKLEEQLRDTFQGLGKLTLNLSHNTSQLNNRAPA